MAMNVGTYYAGTPNGVFSSDRLYGTSAAHEVESGASIKFDTTRHGSYSAAHSFDAAATLHGYQGQLQQHPTAAGLGFTSYGPFDSQPGGAKSSPAMGSYPAFNYAPCGQPSAYPGHPSLAATPSRYLNDAGKFDATGNDVISQYGGRHFGTAAMMAAAAVASMGGQHHAVGSAACPTLPIYPWMRSMGAGRLL